MKELLKFTVGMVALALYVPLLVAEWLLRLLKKFFNFLYIALLNFLIERGRKKVEKKYEREAEGEIPNL